MVASDRRFLFDRFRRGGGGIGIKSLFVAAVVLVLLLLEDDKDVFRAIPVGELDNDDGSELDERLDDDRG